MIMYKFLDVECKIDFESFLSIDAVTGRLYKKDFKSFYDLYEYIEFNLKDITHILFDGYEYHLKHGKLHNLYGPAHTRYNVAHDCYINNTTIYKFYIDGKLVFDNISNPIKGCSKIENFKNNEIFFYNELINKKSGIDMITGKFNRRKEGVDYEKTIINLPERIKTEKRRLKLISLNGR